jgi:ABC-type hemin transport system substrate-binding protein
MKTLQELIAARAAKVDALLALDTKMSADGYTVVKEDDDAWAGLKKEIADLDKAIERKKEADALKASVATSVTRPRQQVDRAGCCP